MEPMSLLAIEKALSGIITFLISKGVGKVFDNLLKKGFNEEEYFKSMKVTLSRLRDLYGSETINEKLEVELLKPKYLKSINDDLSLCEIPHQSLIRKFLRDKSVNEDFINSFYEILFQELAKHEQSGEKLWKYFQQNDVKQLIKSTDATERNVSKLLAEKKLLNKKIEASSSNILSIQEKLELVIAHLKSNNLEKSNQVIKRKEYPKPESLFDRFIRPADQFNFGSLNNSKLELYELSKKENQYNLIDVVEKSTRIVLLGIGGIGKSIELEKLAHHYSKTSHYVIFIKLRNTSNESIEELLSNELEGWEQIPGDSLIIILDAIEEVHQPDYSRFIRKLNTFCRKRQKPKFIVSARVSFYSNSNNEGKGTLSDFEEYGLVPLSHQQIVNYIRSQVSSALLRKFMNKAFELKIYDLLQSPFYLINIIQLYKNRGSLPSKKSSLFGDLISQKITAELKKYHLDGSSLESYINQISIEIQKVAFTAECLEKNSLEEYTEFQAVVRPEIIDKINKAYLLNKVDRKREFDHNLFQEYLAASYLSKTDLTFIQKVTCLDKEGKVINPSWHNTLTFLISILEKENPLFNETLNWITETEEELIFLMEEDTLSTDTKEEFAIKIIEKYENKNLWCRGQLFSFNNVMNLLSNNHETVKWCINRCKSNNEKILVHSLMILKRQILNEDSKSEVKPILLEQFFNDQHNNFVYVELCEMLIQIGVLEDRISDNLISKPGFYQSEELKLSAFQYIYHCKYADKYVDMLIKCIAHAKSRFVSRRYSESEELGEISDKVTRYLVKNLTSIQTDSAKEKIFDWIKLNVNSHDEFNNTIIEEVMIAISGDSCYFNFFQELLLRYQGTRNHRKRELIINYFDIHNFKLEVLKIFLDRNKKIEKQSYYQIPFLLDSSLIKYLINEYKSGNISSQQIKGIRNLAMNCRLEYFDVFQSMLLRLDRSEFKFTKLRKEEQWDYIFKKRNQIDLHLLFNRPKVFKEIEQIYSEAGKTSLSKDDFNILYSVDHKYCQWIVSLLRDFIDEEEDIPKEKIESFLSDNNKWEWFKSQELIRRHQNNDNIGVKGTNFLKSYFKKNVGDSDFKNSITVHQDGSYNYQLLEVSLIYIYSNFSVQAKKHILLNMLYYASSSLLLGKNSQEEDVSYNLIDLLVNQYGEKKVLTKIFEVLQSKKAAYFVKKALIYFCGKNNYEEVLPYIPKLILDQNFTRYDKNRLIEQFFNLGGTFRLIEKYYQTQPLEIRFGIIRLSHRSNRDDTNVAFLINELLKEDLKSEDQLTAVILKIETGILEGYIDLKELIKSKNEIPDERFINNNFEGDCSIEVTRSLFEIYEYLNDLPIGNNPFKGKNVYLELIINAGMTSEENFKIVCKQFRIWIESLENHQFLDNRLVELTKGYYRKKRNPMKIDDVKQLISMNSSSY